MVFFKIKNENEYSEFNLEEKCLGRYELSLFFPREKFAGRE